MSARGDDVSDLFKSFGAEKNQFRELARSSDAAAAEGRWPLFKMIQAEEQASVPPLSNLAKTRWQNEAQPLPKNLRAAPGPIENDMMAQSLRQLSRQPSPQQAVKPELAARPFPALQAQRRQESEPVQGGETPRALFGRSVRELQPSIKQPSMPGLFSKKSDASAKHGVSADDSLTSIFKRLHDEAPSAPARKPSFLRQTERR